MTYTQVGNNGLGWSTGRLSTVEANLRAATNLRELEMEPQLKSQLWSPVSGTRSLTSL